MTIAATFAGMTATETASRIGLMRGTIPGASDLMSACSRAAVPLASAVRTCSVGVIPSNDCRSAEVDLRRDRFSDRPVLAVADDADDLDGLRAVSKRPAEGVAVPEGARERFVDDDHAR